MLFRRALSGARFALAQAVSVCRVSAKVEPDAWLFLAILRIALEPAFLGSSASDLFAANGILETTDGGLHFTRRLLARAVIERFRPR
jgi:hypothetical protein